MIRKLLTNFRSLRGRMMIILFSMALACLAVSLGLTACLLNVYFTGQAVSAVQSRLAGAVVSSKPGHYYEDDRFLAIFDAQGNFVVQWGTDHGMTLPTASEVIAASGQPPRQSAEGNYWYGVARFPSGHYVLAAQSTIGYQHTVSAILRWEGIVGVITWLLALAVFWGSARWVLRPLTQLAAATQKAATGDLSERVDIANAPTELRRLGNAFNIMLKRLSTAFDIRDDAERQLRHFLALTGHELRTPLTTIRGYAQLAELGGLSAPEDVSVVMERVQHEAKRMTSLVEELMLLTRLDEGRALERDLVDLGALCGGVAADARICTPDRLFDCEIGSGPHFVLGDKFRLQQVLMNLLWNVKAHTPSGTPAKMRLSRDGDEVVIDVIDAGPGIPEEHRTAVFDRFFQGGGVRYDGKGTGSGEGLGLGLSIVAAITAAHGGTVAVVPFEHGAWLQVRLPMVRLVAETEPIVVEQRRSIESVVYETT
jgi:two-component system, OmpR family, sensor kinase